MQMDESSHAPQPNGRIFDVQTSHHQHVQPLFPQVRISPEYMPNGRKSLSSIAENAGSLGLALGVSLLIALQLAYAEHYLWRIPFFISVLAAFHFLEFDMTARYNPPDAKVSSFLLFNNGRAYNIAHTTAMLEVLLRHWLTSSGILTSTILPETVTATVQRLPFSISVVLGIVLIGLGQAFRSLAMKQAGTSFNHIVQSSKKEDHVLVTSGVYRVSRHPAYFGFFWWALGTQLVLGNPICSVAYAAVMWKFFSHRITHEEKHLVSFFEQDYHQYRKTTPVRIPFIA